MLKHAFDPDAARAEGRSLLRMTGVPSSEFSLGGLPIETAAAGALSPTLISFVIINWNYADYVAATIESVKKQDYPHFECIVINNGSTDNSRVVIERSIADDPRFEAHQLESNMGQLGAAFWALKKIRGAFVVFVDADDVLFQNFASTHLQVHLALPYSVAFSSSSVVEMNSSGRPLSGSYANISLRNRDLQMGLRKPNQALRLSSVDDETYVALNAVTGALPRTVRGWHWGPGTANVYRRSLLELAAIGDGDTPFMRSADGHFNYLCHSLGGSALIDLPLSAYRIHGGNYFAAREHIGGLRKTTPAHIEKLKKEKLESLEFVLRSADAFKHLTEGNYWDLVDQFAKRPTHKLRRFFRATDAEALFVRHSRTLLATFGERELSRQMVRRLGFRRAQKVLAAARGQRLPVKRALSMLAYAGWYGVAGMASRVLPRRKRQAR